MSIRYLMVTNVILLGGSFKLESLVTRHINFGFNGNHYPMKKYTILTNIKFINTNTLYNVYLAFKSANQNIP